MGTRVLHWVGRGGGGRAGSAPGLDDNVVAGGGQAVGQFGGVPGGAALVRYGRPDQRDPHAPTGSDSHTVYWMGQVRVAGAVRSCASCVVSRLTTCRGPPPYGASRAWSLAMSTGRRPARSMPASTAVTVFAVGWSTMAVGVSHVPRATWANRSAVRESRMTTDASGPIAVHSPSTAASSPGPMRRNAMPFAVRCVPEPEAFGLEPRSRLVRVAGMSSEAAQHEATTPEVARARPRWPARSPPPSAARLPRPPWRARLPSQAEAPTAPRMSPGSTKGTRRREAQGCSGEMAGRHRTVTMTHNAMSSGSAQVQAWAPGSVQVARALTPRPARTARPAAPSRTAGRPRYHITQTRPFWSYRPWSRSGRTARAAKAAMTRAAAAGGSQVVALWLARSRLSWFWIGKPRAIAVSATTTAVIRPSGRSEGPTRSR